MESLVITEIKTFWASIQTDHHSWLRWLYVASWQLAQSSREEIAQKQ